LRDILEETPENSGHKNNLRGIKLEPNSTGEEEPPWAEKVRVLMPASGKTVPAACEKIHRK
jgi:hypothetical protein